METLPIIGISMWAIIKFFALFILGMYLIFGLVVVRQVKMMTDTLQLGFETLAKLLAYGHMAFAILVFLTALIIL
jgi:hypothetical protein